MMDNITQNNTTRLIRRGWTVQRVEAEPPYSFSIGMHAMSHPEIILAGYGVDTSTMLINFVGHLIQNGVRLTDRSASMEMIEDFPVLFREIDQASVKRYCGTFDTIPRMLQMFLPDGRGAASWLGYETMGMNQSYLGMNLTYASYL